MFVCTEQEIMAQNNKKKSTNVNDVQKKSNLNAF